MKILSIANQKGGQAKTTTTVHLAYAALEAGLRVLLVDMDVQGNSSAMFKSWNDTIGGLVSSQLFDEVISDVKPHVVSDKLSVIRADLGLTAFMGLTNDSSDWVGLVKRPAKALQRFKNDFDLCLIDCPPALGAQLMACLTASDYVLTPVAMGKYELDGVNELMNTIKIVRTSGFNPRLRHVGWLPSKIGRSKMDRIALEGLRSTYGASILPFTMMERAAVKASIQNGVAVWNGVRGISHKKAATEWQEACQYILSAVLK